MRELSLHILDLVQNSVEAQATRIELEIDEDPAADRLVIRVSDNGRGMDEEIRRNVTDPFVTSRTTRRIGLGLPLIDMSTRRCDGRLVLESAPGKGTMVEATYRLSHLDRPPLGNMVETVKSIIVLNPEIDFVYSHTRGGNSFRVSTRELSEALEGIPFTHPDVLAWIHEYLTDGCNALYGGVEI